MREVAEGLVDIRIPDTGCVSRRVGYKRVCGCDVSLSDLLTHGSRLELVRAKNLIDLISLLTLITRIT